MRGKKYFTFIIALIIGMAVLSSSVQAKETIKIGVVVPLTGSFADAGNEMVRGAKMAVEKINGGGGLLGKTLEIIVGDVGNFSAEKIVSVGERLVNRDKVDLLLTHFLGGVIDIKAFGKYDIPYLHNDTSQAAAKLVSENLHQYWNVFQSDSTEMSYPKGILHFVTHSFSAATRYDYNNKKIALVTMERAYNERISKEFKSLVKKSNWELVVDEKTPGGTVEWASALTKIRKEKPSVIFLNDHIPSDEIAFIEQFKMNPTKSLIFIQYGPGNPAFLTLGKQKTNGIFWGSNWGAFGKKGQEWRRNYEKKFGEKAGIGTGAGTYSNTMIWAEAVKKAGNEKNYKEVCRMIREYPHQVVGGVHVFNPNTQTAIYGEGLLPMLIFQVQNEVHKLVAPIVYAEADMLVPEWMK